MTIAIIKTGGKQYIAEEGKKLKIEKVIGSYQVGDILSFTDILLLDNNGEVQVGTPIVKGSEVKAEITKIDRLAKVVTIKYKQKSRYQKKIGHRQPYFEVKIISIK